MAQRLLDAFAQYFSDAGEVLTDGQLRFCVSGGSTSDLLDTFSDINLENPNTNPLPLEAGGRVPDCYGYNRYYKIRLEYTDGTLIQEFDPVGGPTADTEFGPWNNELVYNKNQIVIYGDKFWRSSVNGNQGGIPGVSDNWEEIKFNEVWDDNIDYPVDFIVQRLGGLYVSTKPTNINQDPQTQFDYWQKINNIPNWGATYTYRQYALSIGSNGVIYVSQQNNNLNHNPVGDSGTWWKELWETIDGLTQVKYLSGGATLSALWDNWLTDSTSFPLPAAASVPANSQLVVTKPDKNRTGTPTVTVFAGDHLEWSGANDTSGIQLLTSKIEVIKFISNGVDAWRIA